MLPFWLPLLLVAPLLALRCCDDGELARFELSCGPDDKSAASASCFCAPRQRFSSLPAPPRILSSPLRARLHL